MSWDINQVFLIGRLTRDPELRYTQTGLAVCNLSLAVGRPSRRDSSGSETSYFDIVVWDKKAQTCSQYLAKGKQLAVQGHLQQRKWEDQNGQKRYKIEIVAENIQFLSPASGSGGGNNYQQQGAMDHGESPAPAQAKDNFDVPFPEDDEIPF